LGAAERLDETVDKLEVVPGFRHGPLGSADDEASF